MRFGSFKDTISESERKFIAFIGLVLLLVGLAKLTEHANVDGLAALATLVGVFALCLLAVKQHPRRL